MRGKNGQVSDSRIKGTKYPPERKRKDRASHSQEFPRARKVCIPSKEPK